MIMGYFINPRRENPSLCALPSSKRSEVGDQLQSTSAGAAGGVGDLLKDTSAGTKVARVYCGLVVSHVHAVQAIVRTDFILT